MKLIQCLLPIYTFLTKLRFINATWFDKFFIYSYFTYKKYVEDPFCAFTENYADCFIQGHVLDIGANMGYTSYVFSKVLASNFAIYAFEPEHTNYTLLIKAAHLYGFIKKTILLNMAIGETVGQTLLWCNPHHPADHRILTEAFKKELVNCKATQATSLMTVDYFLQSLQIKEPIAFIKLDVQGYELAVCRGMESTLAQNPDCIIAFEYCPYLIKKLGYQADALIDFFRDKQYYLYQLHKRGRLTPFNNEQSKEDLNHYYDVICSLKPLPLIQSHI